MQNYFFCVKGFQREWYIDFLEKLLSTNDYGKNLPNNFSVQIMVVEDRCVLIQYDKLILNYIIFWIGYFVLKTHMFHRNAFKSSQIRIVAIFDPNQF